MSPRRLERRLGLLLALQFAVPGAWLPGLLSYLTGARDFTVGEVGVVMAATTLGAILAPFYVGQLADRVFHAERLLAICHLATAGLLALLAQVESFSAIVLTGLAIGLVYAPSIGLGQSICLTHLGSRDRMGPVRAWGTVGWVVSGIVVAQWLSWRHTPSGALESTIRTAQDLGRRDGIWLAAALALIQGLFCWFGLPQTPPRRQEASFAPAEALRHFRRQPLLTLIVAAFLLACVDRFYLFHGAEFLSRWGRDEPGVLDRVFGVGGVGLLSLGQVSEIGLLFLFPVIAARLSARRMLLIASATFALRMALFSWAEALPLVLVGVALHGVCFTLFFFAGFLVVDECCPASVRTSAQGLFQLVFGGLGGFCGSLLAGRAGEWARAGDTLDPSRLFLVPLAFATAATVLLWLCYPRRSAQP